MSLTMIRPSLKVARQNIQRACPMPNAFQVLSDCGTFLIGPEWRKWQTQQTQNLTELCSVWVRLPPPGPFFCFRENRRAPRNPHNSDLTAVQSGRTGAAYSSPKTATLFGVPTNTLPFAIMGVMNFVPANCSRLPDAWLEL